MKKMLILLLLFVGLKAYSQLPSSLPISIQDIKAERTGGDGTGWFDMQGEADLWFDRFSDDVDFDKSDGISIQDWLGKRWTPDTPDPEPTPQIISISPTSYSINSAGLHYLHVTAVGDWTATLHFPLAPPKWGIIMIDGDGSGNGDAVFSFWYDVYADDYCEITVTSDSGNSSKTTKWYYHITAP